MQLSLDPLLMNDEVQAMQPILPSWPANFLVIFYLDTSQLYNSPVLVPTARLSPFEDQLTLVT